MEEEERKIKQYTPKQIRENKHLTILDHGEPGSGKTYFAGKAIKVMELLGKKSLIVVADPNELYTISSLPEPPSEESWKVWQVENNNDLYATYQSLVKNEAKYGLVIVDNLTTIQRVSKGDLVVKKNAGKEDKALEAMMTSDAKLDWGNWGQLDMNVSTFVYRLKMLDTFHLICTCHTDTHKSPRGETKLYPLLQGGFRFSVGGMFDIIFHSFIANEGGETLHCKTTHGSSILMARDRIGLGERTMVDPDFKTLIDIKGGAVPPVPTEMERRIDKLQYALKVEAKSEPKVKGEKE